MNSKLFDTVVTIVFYFLFNLAVSALCMLFLQITFRECLVYSAANSLWMTVVMPPIMRSFNFRRH